LQYLKDNENEIVKSKLGEDLIYSLLKDKNVMDYYSVLNKLLMKYKNDDYRKEIVFELVPMIKDIIDKMKETANYEEAKKYFNDLDKMILRIMEYAIIGDCAEIPDQLEDLAIDMEHIDEELSKRIVYENAKNNKYDF
jgi:hypothetical protein